MISWINNLDMRILLSLNGFFSHHGGFLNKLFAEYLTYSLPIILVGLWIWPKNTAKKVAMRAVASIILAWPILSYAIAHWVKRTRPFEITGVRELVFHRPDVSFPSDHAATLFAVAMSFYLSDYKILSYIMFAIAIVVSFFRVATGIHFPSDIVAGAIVGVVSAIIVKLLDSYLDIIYNFVLKILKKVYLA